MVRERRADWNKNYDIIVGLNCATEYYYIGVYIPTSDIHFYSLPSICDQQKKRKKKRTHTSCPCIRVSETTDNSAAHMRKPIAAAIYKSFAQCTNTWFSFFFLVLVVVASAAAAAAAETVAAVRSFLFGMRVACSTTCADGRAVLAVRLSTALQHCPSGSQHVFGTDIGR